MNEKTLQMFDNPEFGTIRTVDIGGDAWLVGKDVAVALGFSNPRDALQNHVDPLDKMQDDGVAIRDSIGRVQHPVIINESGLYSLVFSSKLETAQKFKRWVTSEVLPSIRKTGGYIIGQEQMTDDELLSAALLVAQNKIEERDKRIAALSSKNKQLKETNEYLTPRSDYCDAVLQSTSTYTVTDIAKEYGWTAARMNTKLHDIGLQYFCKSKRGDKMITHWYLYSKFDGEGFVEYETTPYFDRETCKKKSSKHMRWTERGKAYIYERLKKEGILPRSEASRKVKEG